MKQTLYQPIDRNVYMGTWNIAKASLDPHEEVAQTIDKIRNDGQSPLKAMVLTEAFGMIVEVDEDNLEHGSMVKRGFTDKYGTVKTSDPNLIGMSLQHATDKMTTQVERLAERFKYKNSLLVAYRDNTPRVSSEGNLEHWQYMAAMSDEDILLSPGRLASRSNIELSFQFAGEDGITVVDAVHYDDRDAKTRVAMSTDFAAKQAASWGHRILFGDLNSINKRRGTGQVLATLGHMLGRSQHTQALADRLQVMANDRTALHRLEELEMEDALEGTPTMKLGSLPLLDLDHCYYDPDIYYPTHWEAFSSPASDHKAIAVSFVPGAGKDTWRDGWQDSNVGKNSTWSYSRPR